MDKRAVRILDVLGTCKKLKINLLAEMLSTSLVTLRKELRSLEKRGIVCLTHGYVSLDGADDTCMRMAVDHSVKRRIAKTAAQIVEEGETIMLKSGSCCALFAEELAISKKNVTIITNSVFIADYVSKLQNIKLILLGGCFQPDSKVLVGPFTVQCSQQFFTDKLFLGTNGFIPDFGFTSRDYLRAETAAELIKRAKKTYVLTESAKFKQRGAFNLVQLDKLAGVFTDDDISKEAEAALLKNNVLLHKVPTVEEKIRWCKFPGHPPFLYTEKE